MPSLRKKFDPSLNFALAIVAIGSVSLTFSVAFGKALDTAKEEMSASQDICNVGITMCMKSIERSPVCKKCATSVGGITSTACQACADEKSGCQVTYNACTGGGGDIHTW